jgi:hypothetical protein
MQKITTEHNEWKTEFRETVQALSSYLDWAERVVLGRWDTAVGGRVGILTRIFSDVSNVKLTYTAAELEEGTEHEPEDCLQALGTLQLGPALRAWAAHSIAEWAAITAAAKPRTTEQ